MTDRRRKQSSASSYGDDMIKDFNAVDPTQPRRRSDWSDHDGGSRQESWMTKVSSAMSTRIFSGGKKMSGSRSTQVMPLGASVSDTSKTSAGRSSSSSFDSQQQQSSSYHSVASLRSMRLVSSEKSLDLNSSSPVMAIGPCPSVSCDVGADSDDGDHYDNRSSRRDSNEHRTNSQRRSFTGRRASRAVAQKVKPGGHESDEDEEVKMTTRVTSVHTRSLYSREARGDDDSETKVQDAAPILKGFFSRDASVGKEIRQQQREQRREALYRDSKQRQDKLREKTERDRVENEELTRRRKIEQLRRLNQQRRLNLLRDATSARAHLLERIQEDTNAYEAERERWELDFEGEMKLLSAAFRKAHTSEQNRPMTVAGLVVPEAISQLEREASTFEKRVKTAEPALGGSPQKWRSDRPSTSSGFDTTSSFFESCQVLALEDSREVLDLFADDCSNSFDTPDSTRTSLQSDIDTNKLLQERDDLLQRLAAIDRMVQSQQQ